MSSTDPFIGLKYGWSATTENFAADMDNNIKTLGALLQLVVESKSVNDPSTLTPTNGKAWIVGTSPIGVWSGKAKQIAAYINSGWVFYPPSVGWVAYIVAENTQAVYKGSGPDWTNNTSAGGAINSGENLGATGQGVYSAVNADKLSFKKLIQGPGITLSSDANSITITADATAASMALNSQTGTAYTLVLTDVGLAIEMNNAAVNTVTIPPNSSVAFGIGTTILIRQMGAGITSIVAGAGVTIRNPHGTLKILNQYATVMLHKRGTDEWCIEGALAGV